MDFKKYKIGMRTAKTGLAVAIGMLLSESLKLHSPLFVGIGAISTMQTSVAESFTMGKNRIFGTVMGALVAVIMSYILPNNIISMGFGIIIVIHILNLMNWKKSISLSAIVFVAVYINHDTAMIPYAINRVLDTLVGIAVGVLVNYFIAAPDNSKVFSSFAEKMTEEAKFCTYDLVVGKKTVDLVDFKDELVSVEKIQDLIENESKIRIGMESWRIESARALKLLTEIYNDLSALAAMKHISIISRSNLNLLEEIFSITPIWSDKPLSSDSDIIFNYHLRRILKNLKELY